MEDSNGFINDSKFESNLGYDIFAVKIIFGRRERELNLTIINSIFNSSNEMIKISNFNNLIIIQSIFTSVGKSKGINSY